MLYGHIERLDDRIDHLRRLRELQDETGGFQTFIPLAFHPEHNMIGQAFPKPTGYDDLRTMAVAAADARQLRPRQGVLGDARRAARADVARVRRRRPRRHRGRERIYHKAGSTVPQELTEPTLHASSARPAACRSSATRSTAS